MRTFKNVFSILLILLGLVILWHSVVARAETHQRQRHIAALLEIKGGIGPATQDFIHRGIEKAKKDQARVIILQIDTPGGLSKSMRGIIKDILSSPIPVISYVAPSGARAASAGTYILYASHVAAMAPGTNLGAATPVSLVSPDKSNDSNDKDKKAKAKQKSASDAKALNDAKAYIRSLAQLRKRNVKWGEKAVNEAASLSANEALRLNVIDHVARDIPELLKQINGKRVLVQGREETLRTLNLSVQQFHPDWRTRFLAVITDPSVAYILLMVGFYGLFFEFANPGFVVPGVAGAICLILAMYAFQLLPINYAGLGLILLGLIFIVAEAFMPSFGALGIGGVISFVIGSILLMRPDAGIYALPIQLIIGVAIVTVIFMLGVLNLAFRSRRRQVVSGSEGMVGKQGYIVHHNQRIWVRVNGELWNMHSDSPLQDGTKVEVERIEGMVLHVKPISSNEGE